MIGTDGERESGKSVLLARLNNNDDINDLRDRGSVSSYKKKMVFDSSLLIHIYRPLRSGRI